MAESRKAGHCNQDESDVEKCLLLEKIIVQNIKKNGEKNENTY